MSIEELITAMIARAKQMNPKEFTKELVGCSDQELQHICDKYNLSGLPDAYRCFMKQMGKQHPQMGDLNMYYPEVLETGDECLRYLDAPPDYCPLVLRDGDFVFAQHHGFAWFFFNVNEGPNPPVYIYWETKQESYAKSFTEFLMKEYGPFRCLQQVF